MGKDGGKEGCGIEELCRERQAPTFSLHSKSDGMMYIAGKHCKTEKSTDKEMMQDHEATERNKNWKGTIVQTKQSWLLFTGHMEYICVCLVFLI